MGSAAGSALVSELVTSHLWPQVAVLTCPIPQMPVAPQIHVPEAGKPWVLGASLMPLLQVPRIPLVPAFLAALGLQHRPGQDAREGTAC